MTQNSHCGIYEDTQFNIGILARDPSDPPLDGDSPPDDDPPPNDGDEDPPPNDTDDDPPGDYNKTGTSGG
ncbi:MAG TPA: hypothetical protein VNO50_17230 [Pyrinomonadaceae bacterium]|nr:hypothetical protein [Pyrinomonadaceae bacterium]